MCTPSTHTATHLRPLTTSRHTIPTASNAPSAANATPAQPVSSPECIMAAGNAPLALLRLCACWLPTQQSSTTGKRHHQQPMPPPPPATVSSPECIVAAGVLWLCPQDLCICAVQCQLMPGNTITYTGGQHLIHPAAAAAARGMFQLSWGSCGCHVMHFEDISKALQRPHAAAVNNCRHSSQSHSHTHAVQDNYMVRALHQDQEPPKK
jgi:hypothetical protein